MVAGGHSTGHANSQVVKMYLDVQLGWENAIRFSASKIEIFLWNVMADVEDVYGNYMISPELYELTEPISDLAIKIHEKLISIAPYLEPVVDHVFIESFLEWCIVNDFLKVSMYRTNIEGGLIAFEVRKTIFGKYLFAAAQNHGITEERGGYTFYTVVIKPVNLS